jgi:hypothetical protein
MDYTFGVFQMRVPVEANPFDLTQIAKAHTAKALEVGGLHPRSGRVRGEPGSRTNDFSSTQGKSNRPLNTRAHGTMCNCRRG